MAKTPRLAIFDTFKTKADQLTGEATRQRAIISILASGSRPVENTRTSIAKTIAERNRIPWKNIYSGIFRDFDEVLIPLGLVREEGRLPIKRGPRALQEQGVPYYWLTTRGRIVALSFDSGKREEILKKLSKGNKNDEQIKVMVRLSKFIPKFVFLIFEYYVRGYCNSRIKDLVPFSADNILRSQTGTLEVYRELLTGFSKMGKDDRQMLAGFLDSTMRFNKH